VQVKRRLKNKEQGSMGSMAAVTASGPQLAMGRVVGSLCVITAKDEDYATGMIASWVSQVGGMGWQVCRVGL
jgi:flavin reductase (DIM6/NTAB) family NADH-FMN oxidoreductase RutF